MAHISYERSLEILNQNLPKTKDSQRVFLDNALNRVLAEEISAKYNNPYMPTASMDGYAIRHDDINNEIKVIGKNPAGRFDYTKIEKNTAVKTYTGSFMPEGSDTLVPIENATVKNGVLKITDPVPKGYAVREVGEDFKQNETLIKKGTLLKPGEIGVLASLGIPVVDVVKKPVISVLATGAEVVDLGEEYKMGQIRSSNNYTLTALGNYLGFETLNMGIAPDDKSVIKEKIISALNSSDIVVTTGGVSVGDFDFVKEITGEFEVLFHGVNIKPGQWVMIAKTANKYIVSLPGFPYSSFVTFLLYVVPIADALEGKKSLKTVTAKLRDGFEKKFKKTQFVAVNLSFENGEYVVDTRGKKQGSSGILTNLINNTALMELKEGLYTLKAGEKVKVIVY